MAHETPFGRPRRTDHVLRWLARMRECAIKMFLADETAPRIDAMGKEEESAGGNERRTLLRLAKRDYGGQASNAEHRRGAVFRRFTRRTASEHRTSDIAQGEIRSHTWTSARRL